VVVVVVGVCVCVCGDGEACFVHTLHSRAITSRSACCARSRRWQRARHDVQSCTLDAPVSGPDSVRWLAEEPHQPLHEWCGVGAAVQCNEWVVGVVWHTQQCSAYVEMQDLSMITMNEIALRTGPRCTQALPRKLQRHRMHRHRCTCQSKARVDARLQGDE
jgi:hypothetical protein